MAIVCDCDDSSLQNTGLPNCVPKFGVTKKIIMVPLYANDGTANFIDLTATLDAAYFNAFINHADSSKRWYPIPGEIKNVESTKSENITEGFNDGSKQFVAEGIRSFTAIFPGLNQITAGQLKASRCSQFGIYEIDNASSLLGYTSNETGKLYPITVDENTTGLSRFLFINVDNGAGKTFQIYLNQKNKIITFDSTENTFDSTILTFDAE